MTDDATQPGPDHKLAAVRLLLGDDLAMRLVDDQWNTMNDFDDHWDEKGHTTRVNKASTALALEILDKLMAALDGPAKDLSNRRQAAMGALTEDERKAWFAGGDTPEAYARERCAPFEDAAPAALFEAEQTEIAHLRALVEDRFADARLVRFEGGQLDMRGSVVHAMAEGLAQCLGLRQDGTALSNYVETRMTHPEIGEMVMTIQRCSGQTPHELRREAERSLAEARQQLAGRDQSKD